MGYPEEEMGTNYRQDLDNANKKLPMKEGILLLSIPAGTNTGAIALNISVILRALGKEAGQWFVDHKIKAVGVDQQALDHPLHTAIGPHGPRPLKKRFSKNTSKLPVMRLWRISRNGNPAIT